MRWGLGREMLLSHGDIDGAGVTELLLAATDLVATLARDVEQRDARFITSD
ncbi:MAG: hypothetical protein QG658_623, partial [Patescibacteria group bacterium]|nr:hypothetical protein [Patescibacteria group bacterium]